MSEIRERIGDFIWKWLEGDGDISLLAERIEAVLRKALEHPSYLAGPKHYNSHDE
jgi:hypothetical protein